LIQWLHQTPDALILWLHGGHYLREITCVERGQYQLALPESCGA